MDDNVKIVTHDLPTWITISKLKNNFFNYKRLAANAKKNIPILFVCLSITITFIYSTFIAHY